MLRINIKITCNGLDFAFDKEVETGVSCVFEIGESNLSDKLWGVIAGIDNDFKGTIESDDINFSHSPANNVLALGNRTVFVRGNVKRNIYKALRVRAKRAEAKQQLQQILENHSLSDIALKNIKQLSDKDLFRVAVARASLRTPQLIIVNRCETFIASCEEECKNFLSKFPDCYIIEII